MEALARQELDLTDETEQTITSSMANQIGWNEDPIGENGILHIEFSSGDRYMYLGVPQMVAIQLLHRATYPDEYDETLEKYFYHNIRTEYEYHKLR